eukprot:XP_003523898.1 dolichyl-diphosphooligosaccharide--protein glycosyltransferase subunit 4A-like [Glycine max]
MIDDEALGVIANILSIFIFALVIGYHLVTADPNIKSSRYLNLIYDVCKQKFSWIQFC